jgi:cytochrome b561
MERYTKPAMLLHWLIALLIISAFGLGLTMVDIPGLTPTKLKYFSWHKWLGVTVLALACVRLLWRLTPRPRPIRLTCRPGSSRPRTACTWAVRADLRRARLRLFLQPGRRRAGGLPGPVALPVLMAPILNKPLLKATHYWLNMTLLAAVALHVLAALKHQFIDRDGTLKRMLPIR